VSRIPASQAIIARGFPISIGNSQHTEYIIEHATGGALPEFWWSRKYGLRAAHAPCHGVACNMHRATCTVHGVVCNMHPAWCGVQHAPCIMHPAWCGVQHAPCNMHPAWCGVQHAPCNMHRASCTVHGQTMNARCMSCVAPCGLQQLHCKLHGCEHCAAGTPGRHIRHALISHLSSVNTTAHQWHNSMD
jgi:hypothetical protein